MHEILSYFSGGKTQIYLLLKRHMDLNQSQGQGFLITISWRNFNLQDIKKNGPNSQEVYNLTKISQYPDEKPLSSFQ